MTVREKSMDEVREAVPLWFSPGTMRFFRSRVGDRLFVGPGGRFFVSSEQFDCWSERRYTVREWKGERIDTVPFPGNPRAAGGVLTGFQAFGSYGTAIRAAQRCAEEGVCHG